jgi:hypothetical protein
MHKTSATSTSTAIRFFSSTRSVATYAYAYAYAAAAIILYPSTNATAMAYSTTKSTSTTSSSSSSIAAITEARKKRLVYGSNDVLFGHIEEKQGSKPFGSFLDAGTGLHSLRWMATLGDLSSSSSSSDDNDNENEDNNTYSNSNNINNNKGLTEFIAVTADETMRKNVQREVDQLDINHLGKVVIGNWFPPDNNESQSLRKIDTDTETGKLKLYDTILADYLIGAMDGFSPYTQDQMIDKLAARLKPGGRLYIVGLEPIPDSYNNGNNNNNSNNNPPPPPPQNIICDVRKIRDACILLSGDRCYREYPLQWVVRQITDKQATNNNNSDSNSKQQQKPLLKLVETQKFPILYRHTTIVKQINVARNKLLKFSSKALAKEMSIELDKLEKRSYYATEAISKDKRIQLGFDYV